MIKDYRAAISSPRLKSSLESKLSPRMSTEEKAEVQQDAAPATEKVTMTKAISKMNKEEVIQELTNRGITYPDKITKVEASALLKSTRDIQDPANLPVL